MSLLNRDIKFLKGVGEKRSILFRNINIHTMEDLLLHIPRDYINRKNKVPISTAQDGEYASFIGTITAINETRTSLGKPQFEIQITDGKNILLCKWFRFGSWFVDKFKLNQEVWVSGIVGTFKGQYQIIHPEIEVLDESSGISDFWKTRNILPIYPLTKNLKMNFVRNCIVQLFKDFHEEIAETLPKEIEASFGFESRYISLQRLHFASDLKKTEIAKKRFAFEELFYHQLMLAKANKNFHQKKNGVTLHLMKTHTTKLKNSLPFKMTSAQKRVIREIVHDMTSGFQMNRLLQGDVGSGKTIVTIFAMLLAVENKQQAILVAPTELLAEQHYKSISQYLNGEEVEIAFLKGGNYKGKKKTKERIKSGDAQIIIGTHALFQKDVAFHKVGFVAIDEQHRFGVEQRAVLVKKNKFPHLLYMSATPIPRSLALTVFGDLDVSVIDELPPTRKPVQTLWRSESKIHFVYEEIHRELTRKRQIYFVCPLIEESDKIQLLDAETLFEKLQNDVFPNYNIALLHGKMKSKEKEEIMKQFKNREYDILVSTTVIEVGIDVPNASVMVIEHAERFGLSQLHQLRGRVGRGSDKATCFLIAFPPISKEGRERLQKMVETNDGFQIAEKDLEIRGPGDFFGTQQSGMPNFKFANLVRDQALLSKARALAVEIVSEKSEFSSNAIIKRYYESKFKDKEKLYRF